MTNRVLVGRMRGSTQKATDTPNGTVLRAMEFDEGMPLMVLPPLLCDAVNSYAARNPSGTTQLQNSNAVSDAQGYVKSQGIAVSRSVAVYRRDTKQLLASGTSGANGFFRLSWRGYSGKVTVVVFDDEAVGFNAKVLDLIVTN